MDFKLEFNTENEAFREAPGLQIVWILGKIAGQIAVAFAKTGCLAPLSKTIQDSNGNTIGKLVIK